MLDLPANPRNIMRCQLSTKSNINDFINDFLLLNISEFKHFLVMQDLTAPYE